MLRVVVCGNRAFKSGVHLGLDASSVRLIAEGVRLEGTNGRDIHVRRDFVFQAHCPEDAVTHQATITFVGQIFRRSVQRREDSPGFARCRLVGASPLRRLRLLRFIDGRIRLHPVEWLSYRQNVAIDGLADVAARLNPDILHAAQNRMRLHCIDDGDAGALSMILTVMTDPRLPEHLMSKPEFIVSGFAAVVVLGKRLSCGDLKRMCRRSHSHHRTASIQISIEMLHLFCRQILEPQEHDCQVCGIKGFHVRNVRRSPCNDLAGARVDVEQYRAFEAVMLCQNSSERWQRFFRAILVIACDEHDMLTLPDPVLPFKDQFGSVQWPGETQIVCNECERDESCECLFHCLLVLRLSIVELRFDISIQTLHFECHCRSC